MKNKRIDRFFDVHKAILSDPIAYVNLGIDGSIHHSELHALRRKVIKSLTKKEKMKINEMVKRDCDSILANWDCIDDTAEILAVILIYAHGINAAAEKIGVLPTALSRWVNGEFPIMQIIRTIKILKDDCPEGEE
jgi:hypothetical protein